MSIVGKLLMAPLVRNRSVALLLIAVTVSLTMSCEGGSPAAPRWDAPVDRRILTPEIAAALTPAGYFPVVWLSDDGVLRITPDSALLITAAFVRVFGSLKLDDWVAAHGAAFTLAELRLCGPLLAADRRYVFDVSEPGTALRNFTSGWYLAQLCGADGRQRVAIAVSAASDVRVTATGALDSVGPNSLYSVGTPSGLEGLLIPTAERAAEIAHQATGQRVATVPALFDSTFPDAPTFARWRVDLEDSVTVRGTQSGTVATIRTVLVGAWESALPIGGVHALLGLSPSEPGSDRDSLPEIGFEPVIWQSVHIRHGLPAAVEPFTIVR